MEPLAAWDNRAPYGGSYRGSRILFLDPPAMASTKRHPAPCLGAHICPPNVHKSQSPLLGVLRMRAHKHRAGHDQLRYLRGRARLSLRTRGSIFWAQPGEGPPLFSPFPPSFNLHFDIFKPLKRHFFRKGGKGSHISADGQQLMNF